MKQWKSTKEKPEAIKQQNWYFRKTKQNSTGSDRGKVKKHQQHQKLKSKQYKCKVFLLVMKIYNE